MAIKSTEIPLPVPLDIKKPTTSSAGNANKDFVFDKVMFDVEALSNLQSVFAPPNHDKSHPAGSEKTASVKFMITIQDESELQALGYGKADIDRLKPQEAAEIILAGRRAEDKTEGMIVEKIVQKVTRIT